MMLKAAVAAARIWSSLELDAGHDVAAASFTPAASSSPTAAVQPIADANMATAGNDTMRLVFMMSIFFLFPCE
jgi:hypothetical protein